MTANLAADSQCRAEMADSLVMSQRLAAPHMQFFAASAVPALHWQPDPAMAW